MSSATIKVCTCEHEGQDKLHGRSRRVHNFAEGSGKWRCTVCCDLKDNSKKDQENRHE